MSCGCESDVTVESVLRGAPTVVVEDFDGEITVMFMGKTYTEFQPLLQADAIAEGIAADVQGRLPRFVFEPVSKFVLEEFDTGLYAQAPFTANDGLRVEVDSPDYRAGASPLWRIGKRMLGTALPKRFSQGEPFNAGLPSAGLDLSVKILSGVAARHRREMTSAH